MKKLLFVLALLMPVEAAAATWRKVAESYDGTTTGWVDASSVRITKAGRGAWVRLGLKTGGWATSYIIVRCLSKTYIEAKVSFYASDGEYSDLTPDEPKWKLATPDTIMEGVLNGVCDQKTW